jgi:hypothetical protein
MISIRPRGPGVGSCSLERDRKPDRADQVFERPRREDPPHRGNRLQLLRQTLAGNWRLPSAGSKSNLFDEGGNGAEV